MYYLFLISCFALSIIGYLETSNLPLAGKLLATLCLLCVSLSFGARLQYGLSKMPRFHYLSNIMLVFSLPYLLYLFIKLGSMKAHSFELGLREYRAQLGVYLIAILIILCAYFFYRGLHDAKYKMLE